MARAGWVLVALVLAGCQPGPGPVEQIQRMPRSVARPSVALDGAPRGLSLIAAGGQNLVGLDAGTLVGLDAGTLVGPDAGSLAGSVPGAPNPVAPGPPSPSASPASPLPSPPPSRLTVEPPPGGASATVVYLQDAEGRLLTGRAGRLLSVALDGADASTVPGVSPELAVCYLVPLGLEGGRAYGLVGLRPAGTVGGLVDAASTLLVGWLRAQPGWDGQALQGLPAEAWWAAQAAVRQALAADPSRLPSDWRPASVLAAVNGLLAAQPVLRSALDPLVDPAVP
ncbi:MAG: hypothetical protein VKQ33_10845 [Candidatus Sericytochromatia bacterium]|nr:hypothetical protein [Candidatus Sericytochromatia bacterium]